jgi:hypothetical protein
MIICTVCGQENDELSTVCSSCKSFIQGRVDALNLFETAWGLAESPAATFKRIVLSRHKNYSLLLSALMGVCLVFEIAWYKNVAQRGPSLASIVAIAFGLGPVLGIALVAIMSFVLTRLSRVLGGRGSRINLFAAITYAFVPMVFVLVFVVPIQLAVFGVDFFSANPPPMLIRPVEYTIILGIKILAAVWTIILLVFAVLAANAFSVKKVVPVTGCVLGLLAILFLTVHFAQW